MPMSPAFKNRLDPLLLSIAEHFGTPFHIFDEAGIRATGRQLIDAFAAVEGFREYFAVKALPNPRVLEIVRSMGFGFDCSSIAELILSRRVGAAGDDIMFTSNNTTREEFVATLDEGGCMLNLDDISLTAKLPHIPERICFRYNPGARRTGNSIIGNPSEAKFGISHEQFLGAYRNAYELGIRRFGLHTMLVSNERDHCSMCQTTQMLLELIEWAQQELGITFELINIGGGLGIPYHPDDQPLNLREMGSMIAGLLHAFRAKHAYAPHVYMESGRYLTGPHGVLITRVINRKNTYRHYVGVDASMSALIRPATYGTYHHIHVSGKENSQNQETVDIVGALCENNDKFAIQRPLPPIEEGDLLIIHDTGAHGHAMGFNYNGRLRPQELLLRLDNTVERIRRAETLEDYFATLDFVQDHLTLPKSEFIVQ